VQQRLVPKTRLIVRYKPAHDSASIAAVGATDAGRAQATAAALAAVSRVLGAASSSFKGARALGVPRTFVVEAKDEAGAAELLARVRSSGMQQWFACSPVADALDFTNCA
jgi:hypothetical protein